MGAGLGLTSSQKRTDVTKNESDVYVNAILGADYRITDSISAYIEGNGKYYLSNNGFGTGLANNGAEKGGFSLGAKAGVKFFF
ncbi:hypothetical protein ACFQDE_13545 [Deinococcus caeni]|uniref:hypothetical protein n=1 Tax=Deinococcus caeni TaxID=569127 RepID=UPI0036228F85